MEQKKFFELVQRNFNHKLNSSDDTGNSSRAGWDNEVQKQGYYILTKGNWFRHAHIAVNFHINIPIALAPHRHDFFEIVYVYQGEITNKIDGKLIEMHQGDICLLNANAIHQIGRVQEQTIVLNILIEKSLFENAFFYVLNGNELIFNFFANSLYKKNQEQNYMLFPLMMYQHTDALEMLQKIIAESFTKQSNYQTATELTIILLFLELTRAYRSYQERESARELNGPDISQIVQYIGEHYQDVTVESTAKQFNYHPNSLSRILKKYTGSTFSDIIQKFRINAAKDYLEHTTMSIDEIVSLVGYANKSYFYRIFREETGMSPAEFRKK